MSQRSAWWVTLGTEDGEVCETFREDYRQSFSAQYLPAPYRMYLGPKQSIDIKLEGSDHVVLGDSTVASTNLCDRLEMRSRSSPRVERFVNLGVTAANSGMSLARIVHDLIQIPPRSITVVGGGSDILMPMSFDPRPGYPHIQFVYDLLFESRFDARQRSIWSERPELGETDLGRDFFERLSSLRKLVGYRSAAWEGEIVDTLVSNVAKMARICSAANVPFLFVLQPTPVFKRSLSVPESKSLPPAASCDYIRRQFEAAAGALGQLDIWAAGRTAFEDLHELFRDETSEIFKDVIHTRQSGVDRVAMAIFDRLETSGCLPESHDRGHLRGDHDG